MLKKEQVVSARQHNIRNIGVLYNNPDLPWPWSNADPESFVWMTAFFQLENELDVDGKLGKKTLEAITALNSPKPSVIKSGDLSAECSNVIIVNGEKISLPKEFVSAGITATNYIDDGEPRFNRRNRNHNVVNFVIHETCGNSAKGCKNTLLKKGYGVQLILNPYGNISCHGDLILDRMVHANQLNDVSFGIEVVNPYNPIYAINDELWNNTIPREWWTWVPSLKGKGGMVDKGIDRLLRSKGLTNVPARYVTPTKMQMKALKLTVPWLCEITGVPYRFPTKGLSRSKRKIDGLNMKPKGRPGPGVVAHRDFASHSDGRYIIEHLAGLRSD